MFLTSYFQLNQKNTSIKTEVLAGLSTFLTMSYIVFVNPSILAQTGMNHGAIFVATCLASSFACLLMGFFANYPIALAPGLGLNAYFTYSVVLGSGHTWQVGLGAVFLSGLLFLLISLLPVRNYMVQSIPPSQKIAIVGGIGLFLGFIGFKNTGLIQAHSSTLLTIGDLHHPETVLSILGFFLIVGLDALGVTGAVIISILSISLLGLSLGYGKFQGIFSFPPSLLPTLLQLDLKGAIHLGLLTIIFAFLFVDFFDNTGTLIAIAHRAGLMTSDGKMPKMGRVLIVDSLAAIFSALLGTSTTTSYVESAIGVRAGGRTGLVAVVVGCLFLCTLFIAPLALSIPMYATAPALIYVACIMMRAFADLNWKEMTEYVPAVITALSMPLTFSIVNGIAFGLISWFAIKLLSGRVKELNLATGILVLLFLLKYTLNF